MATCLLRVSVDQFSADITKQYQKIEQEQGLTIRQRAMLRRAKRLARRADVKVVSKVVSMKEIAPIELPHVHATELVSVSSLHAAAPESSSSSSASSQSSESSQVLIASNTSNDSTFPAFDHASFPVAKIPNWGAMRSPEEWTRSYKEYKKEELVSIPAYDVSVLTTPLKDLTNPITSLTIPKITAKLFYSTRFFGAYSVDSAEFTAIHPGVDLKLALGTPIGAIGGGLVREVETNENLGLHVVIEHRIGNATYYSIYGHLGAASVSVGDDVKPGDTIGVVGMTGDTTAPHLHLQIDRGQSDEVHHEPYFPDSVPSPAEAGRFVVNPITFIMRN